jgi:hypothetical protein
MNNETYAFDEVQGKMLTVDYAVSHHSFELTTRAPVAFQDLVKEQLCNMILQKMKESNCIEFTRQEIPGEFITKFRARIFVTPDDKVRILRQHQNLL